VFHTTGGDVLKYAAAGQLSEPPLTDAERRDFNPSALQATTYKGKVVAYPLWIVPWFEYINVDLFKEAGVTPPKDGNWTYDEFLAAAKKLTFKRANGKQAYGFAHANDEFAFMLIDGGRPYDKDVKTWTFNSAEAVSGLEKWVALAQAKVMPPDFLTLNPNDSQARFLSGDIAILQRPSAMINVLNADKNWEFGKNWDIANFPKAKGDQTAWGGVGFIAVREQQDANRKAAALRRHGWSYLFVLPTFSLFVLFTLLPVAQGLVLALQDARVTGGTFIGLANFGTLADDSAFRQALGNTVLYATVVVAAQVTLALVVASLIQPLGARSRVFYRALFYLPLVNSAILV